MFFKNKMNFIRKIMEILRIELEHLFIVFIIALFIITFLDAKYRYSDPILIKIIQLKNDIFKDNYDIEKDVITLNKKEADFINRKILLKKVTKDVLKREFKWFNENYYYWIKRYCNMHVIFVFSLIEAESGGYKYAIGKEVDVELYIDNKLTKIRSRAIGLMQVLNFYDNEKDLFNPKNNIEWGCNILNKCIIDNNNLNDVLKCYNSGQNSNYYNWKYINKIKNRSNEIIKKIKNEIINHKEF
ncbi:MAG: lytic transglycosylase domain-containing protein [Candidatus Aenigmatarchaeota archaeon]